MAENYLFVNSNNTLCTYQDPDQGSFSNLQQIIVSSTDGQNLTLNPNSVILSNSSVNLTITKPTLDQQTDKNYYLNANGTWALISGDANDYVLPIASMTTLGGVKVDGDTIKIDAGGTITAPGAFVNAAFVATISANNASYLEGKLEADLNVNSAATSASSLSANNAAYLAGKLEADLDVKSAVVAKIVRPGDGSPIWTSGVGDPEGVVFAAIGSLYTRTDGDANTTLYVKESGTDDTGWVAK